MDFLLEPSFSSRNALNDADLDALNEMEDADMTTPAQPIDFTLSRNYDQSSINKGRSDDFKVSCDLLIVAHGLVPCAFLRTLFVGSDVKSLSTDFTLIGSIMVPEVPVLHTSANPELSDGISWLYYSSATNTVLVLIRQAIPESRAFEWTESLFQNVSCKHVKLFDMLPSEKYNPVTQATVDPPLLRHLATSSTPVEHALNSNLVFLEQPNLVDLCPVSSIMSHCEVSSVPAQLFLALDSYHFAPNEVVRGFEKTLTDPVLQKIIPERSQRKFKTLFDNNAIFMKIYQLMNVSSNTMTVVPPEFG